MYEMCKCMFLYECVFVNFLMCLNNIYYFLEFKIVYLKFHPASNSLTNNGNKSYGFFFFKNLIYLENGEVISKNVGRHKLLRIPHISMDLVVLMSNSSRFLKGLLIYVITNLLVSGGAGATDD